MKKTKILIVEDEIIVALDLKSAMIIIGYEVTEIVTNCIDVLKSIRENEPDVILMDINLENSKDGIDTIREVYNIKYIPVLYLTGLVDDKTIIRAIETNPIGYLVKPFVRAELKTTIALGLYKLNKKKEKIIKNNCICFATNYYFNLKSNALFFKTIPIKLSIKESLLLKTLIEANGTILTFGELEYLIWPDGLMAKNSLRTLIYRLRSKLEFSIIETIPSCGCKIKGFKK